MAGENAEAANKRIETFYSLCNLGRRENSVKAEAAIERIETCNSDGSQRG